MGNALITALGGGLSLSGSAAFYAWGRDDVGTAAAGGAIGGSVLGIGMGIWLANNASEESFKRGVRECLMDRGYEIRGWE